MAVLANCWLIIEAIIIPDGLFLKWFYLSFYIHTFFLCVCQIFLWLKLILQYILVIFFYPYKIFSLVCLYVFKFFKNCVIYVFSSTRLTDTTSEATDLVQKCSQNQSFISHSTYSSIAPISCKGFEVENYKFKDDQVSCDVEKIEEEEEEIIDDDDLCSICSNSESSSSDSVKVNDEYIPSSVCSSNSPEADKLPDLTNEYSLLAKNSNSNSPPLPEDQDSNEYSTTFNCCFNSLGVVERQETNNNNNGRDQKNGSDTFYDKYTERMRWFDVLNYDRTCGISTILNRQIGTPSSIESNNTEAVDFLVSPYILWGKTARKNLLRSLENDFELVYVAQACLSWEALHHQYRKVEGLASQNGVFYDNVAGEFQKFQVLLERFMEDERCEGKRVWNYVRGRFSLKSLLQVPMVSGFFEQEMEEMKIEGINVKEVLKAIERCIEAYWVFVKTDDKKPWWKFRSSLWTCPPVEDPRDLKLLADLTSQLRKKEVWLKDSQGKQRCWIRKVVNPVEESQRKEMMFTMIDIKLVSRVLQLPVLSSSQLKWCQEMLDNIEFVERKIVRACNCGPLFPP